MHLTKQMNLMLFKSQDILDPLKISINAKITRFEIQKLCVYMHKNHTRSLNR